MDLWPKMISSRNASSKANYLYQAFNDVSLMEEIKIK